MDVLYERVAGIDIGKAKLVACVRTPRPDGRRGHVEATRSYSTMARSLLELAEWLVEQRVELVAMESTADYWKPVYYAVEAAGLRVWLVNARHLKNVPGRKTDVRDAAWIAQTAQHGLVRPSLVPPPPVRRLRDLTRQRTNLIRERTRAISQLEKVLEDAGIKTSAVMSKTLSRSTRAMIEALIAGERDPQKLADLALGRARAKIGDLREALVGRFEDHHAFLAQRALAHIDHLSAEIDAFTAQIETELEPFRAQAKRLTTIPGVSDRIAQIIIAETGADMTRFPTAAALAKWAGLAPGNNESAGRHLSGATTPGNTWLGGALGDAAAAASRTRDTYLGAHYRRLARRRGGKRALVAVMHKILIAVWHMLSTDTDYHDLGADHYQNHPGRKEARKRRLLAELAALGVDTTPLTKAS